MSDTLSSFAARLLREVRADSTFPGFADMAMDLFRLQWTRNEAYRRYAIATGVEPGCVLSWEEIPAVPARAFKDLDLTSLPPSSRTRVFHSSGTTASKPSRHFHGPESLAVYEAAMEAGFQRGFLRLAPGAGSGGHAGRGWLPVSLTPTPRDAPHSSLVHMIHGVGRRFGAGETVFAGRVGVGGVWELDIDRAVATLQAAEGDRRRVVVFGTAFNFVHLVEGLGRLGMLCRLEADSQVMETGGYKGRSREWTKGELRGAITRSLGVSAASIIGEYGMSELSSQAYEAPDSTLLAGGGDGGERARVFVFPPWARAIVISPETGREAKDGETGLLRVIDLANVWSVMAVQAEDRAVKRGRGVELLGRAPVAEPRGCSLMTA